MYGSKCSRPVPVNEPLVREHLTGAKTGCIQLVNKGGTAIKSPFGILTDTKAVFM